MVLKYLKLILNMKTSTPNFMVYGETGVYPIYIDVYCRMIYFWATLVSGPPTKLSYIIYHTAYSLYRFGNNSNINSNGFTPLGIFYVVVVCHRLNCDDCLGGVMGSVLMCIGNES